MADEKVKPIYVIAAKDPSLLNADCDKLLDYLIPSEQRTTGLFKADAKNSIAEILDELRTLPFLAERRIVIIKDADKFISNNRSALENYFQNPSPTGILILAVSSWPSNTKLAKMLTKTGTLIKLTQPKTWQLPQKLIEYTRDAHNQLLARNAAQMLVELVGDDLPRLYTEVDKLSLFAVDQKTITPQHVESLIGHNRFFNAFAVIDSVLAKKPAQAVDRLRNMFATDRTTEYTVIGAFAFHVRRLFNAKAMLEQGRSPADIISQLRIWSNKDSFFAQLKKMSLKQIGSLLSQLAETDYAIKTGRTTPQIAIEMLVLKLASAA